MTAGLVVDRVSVSYRTAAGLVRAVRDVSFAVAPGEALAVVGESGSGKSSLAFALAEYAAPNAVRGGRASLDGVPLSAADRGRRIAMVFQDPAASLNPTMRLGAQVDEVLARVRGLDGAAALAERRRLFARVQLADAEAIAARYPHEASGGEKQRVLIAMALAAAPRLLVCDEPTTALDATTAAGVLDLIAGLRRDENLAVLYITHDLAVAARIADRVAVLYAGTLIEEGPAEAVLGAPRHPYTRLLLDCVPDPHAVTRRLPAPMAGQLPDLAALPPGCVFAPRCPLRIAACEAAPPPLEGGAHRVACIRTAETARLASAGAAPAARDSGATLLTVDGVSVVHGRRGLLDRVLGRSGVVRAVRDASLALAAGEVFGLIGESGCGKSSLLRALAGIAPYAGRIAFDGAAAAGGEARPPAWRRDIQLVFQHPDASLNPRMRVGAALARPLALHRGLAGAALRAAVVGWLERVRLPASHASRWPHQLSGGEKQRVAIARAFAAEPKLVLCDEITSGLDVSVQAAILDLLTRLRAETGVALLLVSHDLNMVQQIADRIAVMYLGRIVESRRLAGPVAPPMHPYTEALLAAAPVPDPLVTARAIRLEGPLPSPASPPPGCAFATRCPRRLGAVCDTPPPWRGHADGALLCHIPLDQLEAVPPIWSRAA